MRGPQLPPLGCEPLLQVALELQERRFILELAALPLGARPLDDQQAPLGWTHQPHGLLPAYEKPREHPHARTIGRNAPPMQVNLRTYSLLSAVTGSTRIARRAGTYDASAPTARSTTPLSA